MIQHPLPYKLLLASLLGLLLTCTVHAQIPPDLPTLERREDSACVPVPALLEALARTLEASNPMMENPTSVLAVCDPCSCPTSTADCLVYMAETSIARAVRWDADRRLLARARQQGICKEESHADD